MAQLIKDFPKDLRYVFRHLPLMGTPEQPFHDKAAISAQAAEAAGRQDKFWEMHDLLFSRQQEWVGMSVDQFKEWAITRAGDLKLDVAKFTTDLTSPELVQFAQDAWNKGNELLQGRPSTPFILIDDQIWPSSTPLSYDNLATIIRLFALGKRQFTSCPPMTIDQNKQYFATLHTNKGDIVLELYPDKASLTVNSFVFLARHGWFDGVMFHRVLPDFMAQAGDPSGTGFGGPGYNFSNENSDLKFDREGVVGMANSGPDSNGSQFFITYAPAPHLDGGYTIFGQLISGMDVLKSLTPRDPGQGGDLPPGDVILSVTIEEK